MADSTRSSAGPTTRTAPGSGSASIRRPTAAPEGRDRFPWYGPGFVWIVASVGSGSVLFTPRVGSRYEYDLLWAALLVILLVWVVIREVGRYTVVTGRSILAGYHDLPGPRGWAVWLIVVPQMIASAVIVAGIAGLVGSALMIALPGAYMTWALGGIVVSCLLVISGRYRWVERVSTLMAGVLVLSAFVTAAVVAPSPGALSAGLVPRFIPDLDLYFIIPWLSFVVAGPAAVLWYSYWLLAREYGGPPGESGETAGEPAGAAGADATARLRDWLRVMSTTAAIGVVGGGAVSLAFLVLGTELLAPAGVMPEGIAVAEDLSRLLADVWGAAGFWLLILGIVIALWGSILANQDGFGRLYADATLLVAPRRWVSRFTRGQDAAGVRRRLQNLFTVGLLTVAPILIVLIARDPVRMLSVGGILAAAHMPLVVLLTLHVNRTRLPGELRPGPWSTAGAVAAALFYLAVAGIFFVGLLAGAGEVL